MNTPATSPQCVLITGGAGFIGSHLAQSLLDQGHRVLAMDDFSTGSQANLAHLLPQAGFGFTQGSILQGDTLEALAAQADVIIHLAAAVGVKLVVEQPVHTIETNVLGTERVLKAALRHRCRVLIASTSEVYGKGSKIPFAEDDDVLLGPTSRSRWSYAASKMVDEFLGLAYHGQHGLPVVLFRLFNTVGARQTGRYGMVIPRFVQQALAGEPLTVYGDGTQRRCFCDVRDVVRAIAALAMHPDAPGRVFNIGGEQEISMADLARRVITLAGSASTLTQIPYSEAYAPGFEDMQRRVPDTSRLRQLIGWQPTYGLDDILRSVIAWQRQSATQG